jgi:PAS domain S-box-containing protein
MTEATGAQPDLLAELTTLGSLAIAAGRGRTSREVATSALEILTRSMGATAGVVLYDGAAGLEVEADTGFPPGAVEALVSDVGISDQLRRALDRGTAPLNAPIDAVPMRPAIMEAIRANGVHHVLVARLRAAGRPVGILGLGWPASPVPPPADVVIQQATTLIGATLENARLVERLQRALAAEEGRTDEEAALQNLTLIAEKAGALEELAARTLRQVVDFAGAAAGSYALVTDDDRLVHSASLGVDRGFIDAALDTPATEMISVKRLLDGGGPYLRDYEPGAVQHDTLVMAGERGWQAFAMIPITVRDRVRALIALFFDRPPDLVQPERTLGAIARIASISLSNFRLRERLQASETRYRVLFEESPDAIVLLSRGNEVIDANPAALRLYRTDLAGLRAFLTNDAPRIDEEERRRRAEIVARDGRGVFRDEGRRPDGTSFPREIGIVGVEIGGEQRHLLIIRDLTEEGQLQQELLQAQKMEAIGQLVSGVAHELNNPLAAIVAFSQLIRRDERLPEDLRRDAQLLVQEADRTRRIVQSLLDFARQRPPERHPTALAALVDSVLALQSYSLTAGRIELAVDVPPDLPLIAVDRSQLQQVFLNLMLNAIQAIRAERSEGRIWITARRVGGGGAARVRLVVADDGPGIPDAVRPRLFLPFFTTKGPGEGTGLGLSVSFGIVASHGGTLRFEPRPGGGATFIMELPVGAGSTQPAVPRDPVAREGATVTRSTTAGAASSGPTPAAPSTKPRVLVLDDEPAIRAFLTKSLRLVGLEAVAVAVGEDAVTHCRAESFAALLIDHRMPGMSGTDVFNAVVAIRPELASRFVFMSGDVLNPELREFAETHGVQLLAKPFDVDTVNRLVEDVVGRQRG